MAMMMRNGDYVSDGQGGFVTVEGAEELLDRILWKLTVRRGSFPFLPELGSRLHLLGRAAPRERESLARQYVAEALRDEEVTVTGVELVTQGTEAQVTAYLDYQGAELSVTVQVGGFA